jgi:putative transposase
MSITFGYPEAVMGQKRADAVIELAGEALAELEKVVRSRRTPQAVALRARIVLMTAEGISPSVIGKELGVTQPTVRKWRARYSEEGLAGLRNEARPGRPRTLDDQQVADLLNKALQTRPTKRTHWSVRSFATEAKISKDMAHRLFRAAGIAPHRSRTFKLSNDPAFVEKVRDITGLYLNPPDNALVLCVDEKSQIQALERTQPLLPMGLGYVEGVTHDYIRHGTTTLFAALNVANGQVISRVRPKHRHQEFLGFLRQIEKETPKDLDLHLIVDNYSTHKHAKVKAWLARHPRFHLHFTPTYSSWLNQVERWFAVITEQAIRRNSFTSVRQLKQQIELFINRYNADASPYKWVATADSILQKIERAAKRISATGH